MISFEVAREKVLDCATPLKVKEVPLKKILGYALAEPLTAAFDLPRFDNSAVDGFGVLIKDTGDAAADSPITLEMVATIAAGSIEQVELKPGQAVKILTGATVPPSVEAVIMQEHCQEGRKGNESIVFVSRHSNFGENIRRAGDEFHEGDQILPAGTLVTPPVVGLLATLGYSSFSVRRKPKIAVIATGDELVSPGDELHDGQIYESNSHALVAAANSLGLKKCRTYKALDSVEELKGVISKALRYGDIIIASGGVSVGDRDFVKEVFEQLGVKTIFWRIAMKPGKPVYFGVYDDDGKRKLVFGLPGNPVSTLVTFTQLVKPAIRKMMGATSTHDQSLEALISEPLSKKPGRLDFVRGIIAGSNKGRLIVRPTIGQDSHMLSGLATADCLVYFEADQTRVPKDSVVQIDLLNWFE